jgi:glycosyltransferase involved in cell wall biosynthesis
VETRQRELMKRHDIQTRVVAPVPWFFSTDQRFGDYARWAETPAKEFRNGLEVWHPRYPLLPKVGESLAPIGLALWSARTLKQFISEGFDFDVIDAHFYYPDGVAAIWLGRLLGKPVCITARGSDLTLYPNHFLPKLWLRWAARHAQASIGVCTSLLDPLRQWGIPQDRLHVFRNGVDLDRFHIKPKEDSRRLLGIRGEPLLLSVGHLIERKGHDLAIESLALLRADHPNSHLVIVGDGPERRRLEHVISKLNLNEHVTLVGKQPNETLSSWYSAADVLILASSREGWANVLLEAMACGTPAVATAVDGTPEVLADPAAGELVHERTAEGIAAATSRLLLRLPSRESVRDFASTMGWADTNLKQYELFKSLAARM